MAGMAGARGRKLVRGAPQAHVQGVAADPAVAIQGGVTPVGTIAGGGRIQGGSCAGLRGGPARAILF